MGMGRMGFRHAQVVGQLQHDLVGVFDRMPEACLAASRELGLPEARCYGDAGRLLGEARPECVIVATHAPSHCDLVCQAAEAGAKFILCEKPMAVSLQQCDRMLACCREHGAKLAINHQMRFMEQYTEPNRIMQSDSFGGLSSMTVVAGNFGMAMNGSHYFEAFRYLTDEPPARVAAWFSDTRLPNPRGPEFEDRAGSVRLETASGKRFYMEIGDDQGHGMHVTYAGPYGRLDVDELAGVMRLATRKAEHRDLPSTRYGMPWDSCELAIKPADAVAPTRSVLEALLADRSYPSGEDGRLAVAVLAAAYESNELGGQQVEIRSEENRHATVFPWA